MSVPFLDASFGQCRTPLWRDSRTTPIADMMVCGEPVLMKRSYCAGCRDVLIAGRLNSDGSPSWFAKVDDRAAGKEMGAGGEVFGKTIRTSELRVSEPEEDDDPAEPELDEDDVEEAEPEGARPLQPADLYDWGAAA